MKNSEFAIWMKGYFELCQEDMLNHKKLYIIKNHLNLVHAVETCLTPANENIFRAVTSALNEGNSISQSALGALKAYVKAQIEA